VETRYLKTLIIAAETGSFSRTAEKLHITQSAVSQRVKFLEDSLGQQLLDRSGPALVPTECGARVIDRALVILAQEKDLLEEIKRFAEGKRISLCCTPTFGTAFLPRLLDRFLLRHADLADLKFVFGQPDQAIRGLKEKEFDVVTIEHCEDRDLEPFFIQPLPEDHLVFISAPILGLDGEMVELEDLQKHRLYARRDGCSSKRLLNRNLEEAGSSIADFQGVVISDDLRLTIESVQAGNGISFISRSLVQEHLSAGALRSHQVPGFLQTRSRSAVLQRDRSNEPLIRTFLECLQEVCGVGICPEPSRREQGKAI